MLILMILLGILMIVGGISCTVFTTLGWLAGISILMVGISAVVRYAFGHEERNIWNLLVGICECLFGGFLIFNNFAQLVTSFMLAYIASFCILVYGIVRIVASLILKKINQALPDETRSAAWLVAMAAGGVDHIDRHCLYRSADGQCYCHWMVCIVFRSGNAFDRGSQFAETVKVFRGRLYI